MNKLHLKKFYFLLIVMPMSFSTAFSQGYNTTSWKFSNPKQFGFTVFDVDYFDNNNAIAVGLNGGIAKSTDGGRNWTYGVYTYINSGGLKVAPTLNDVHFISSNTAYAVGNNGVMIKTTDGGATWNFVNNPLLANAKNINATWFLDANRGYMGGDYNNTPDSLPKLYFTLNGGSSWDSIVAPAVNGVSRVGYINNPLIPSVLAPVDAKLKSIHRIEFINNNIGYISGSNSYGVSLFPPVSFRATSTTVCTPLTTFLTTGSMAASLLWKFDNGVLTDYSISKERIGYTGINTNTINCTTTFGTVTPITQQYRAMNIINDSTVVIMSLNNNTVIKVNTGINDSTANVNAPGVFEKGKYEVLNFPFPPTQGPNAGPPIPNPQVLLASNPYQMRRTAAGTLVVNGNFGRLFTSVDTGRNWIQTASLPQGQNFSNDGVWALDIAPNGRFLSMGANGVTADSLPGGSWFSNYVTIPYSASYNEMEFTDCNNGMAVGGSFITVTTDGGNTWIDRQSPVLAALFASINSVNYLNPAKAYFTTSIGNLYRTINQAVTLSPVFAEPFARLNDLATIGNDSLWMAGVFFNSPLPAANRQGAIFRSFDNGANWDTIRVGPMGSTTYLEFRKIEMVNRLIGYAAGTRNAIWKTIDGGATWTDISPVPSLSANMSYTGLQALNKDTVFACGNGFPAKVIYRTTDGGATWVDITGNLTSLGGGNINGVLMHDVNNGYACSPGGYLFITNNGGATWTLDIAPTANLFTAMAFVPKTVGPSVSMVNRKMFVSGPNINGAPMMEYGNPASTTVNSTELIAGPTCTSPNSGTITINATGGIAPYMYQLGAGPFQSSNVFTGLAAGTYSITIRDSYCGLLTKSVTISQTDDQVINVSPASATVCAGVPVQLNASGNSTSYSWSPTTGLNNPNIANPIATVNTTTIYTVTGTLNNCTKTATVTITINPNSPITIVAIPGTTLCEGDPAMLTVHDGSLTGPLTIPLNAQTATFTGNARGYFFTAPANFTMTALRVPTDASAGNQHIAVVRFNPAAAPPAFPATTNAFTTLFLTQNNASAGSIPVNIPIVAGDVIGIMGTRGGDVNSYAAAPNVTTIAGFPVSLLRMGMQLPLSTNVPQNIWSEVANPITRVFFDYTYGTAGPVSTGTFLWTPAAGLSSTTSNPTAASPMTTTTYTVTRTTGAGCVASANITLTINQRPKVTSQPGNLTVCSGSSTSFTVAGTGTGLAYQWQLSTAGPAGPWVNLANTAPYSGVNTATLTVNPATVAMSGYAYRCVLSGTCAPGIPAQNVSNAAVLTVNALPTVSVTPTSGCGGVAGINGLLLTASGASTYTWAPVAGLYTNATTTTPYTGGNTATVYAAPTTFTVYTVTGTNSTTGCSSTASAQINYTPPAPTVTPASVTMCLGDPAVKLKSSSSQQFTASFTSGTINVTIPDGPTIPPVPTSYPAVASNITVSGIPAGATIANVRARFNITHAWVSDLVIALRAPNGQVINLCALANYANPAGANFTNTTISSAGTAPLTAPYTGTYRADLAGATFTAFGFTFPGGPTGYVPTSTVWSSLYSTPNGVWSIGLYDAGAPDGGTFNSWSLDIDYIVGVPATPAVWTPAAGLFSDAAALIPYVAGTAVDSVWTRPTPSGVYNYQATVQSLSLPPSSITTTFTNNNQFALVTSNFTNNNAFPVTITGIESVASTSGGSTARLYYKTSAIAGAPGAISAANGWILAGTGTYTAIANTTTTTPQPMLSGLSLVIPAGATYGIAFESQLTGGAGNLRYSTVAAGTYTNTGGGCVLTSGTNVSFAGDLAPIAPTFTPRAFIGRILFSGANAAPCTSPARNITVTVNQPVSVTTQPVNRTICTDKVATFTVAATASGTLTYQWQVSTNNGGTWANVPAGGVYAGGTSSTLTITAPPVSMSGYYYRCVITGAAPCPSVNSGFGILTVNPLPTVVITASPYVSLLPGMTTTLSSTVSPNAAATYTWFRNGTAVSGANTGTLNVNVDGMGNYQLTVTDVNGCTNSSNIVTIRDSVSARCFIYPNPSDGMFQVRYYSVANNVLPRVLTVYDSKGDRVLTQRYTIGRPYDRMDVDLRRNGKGLYWVEIGDMNGNRLTMCRVAIQ